MTSSGIGSVRLCRRIRLTTLSVLLLACLIATPHRVEGQVAGDNVNMVSGTEWPGGDPFLQRQNEPSIAVSSRNPQHLLAGANDYRTVDLPGLPGDVVATGDAWLGVFKSFDGGATWQSTLLPGYPQDVSPEGLASPLTGTAGADPVVRAGTHGLFYYLGITFDRDMNESQIFVARFIDLNNKENGDISLGSDPMQYTGEFVANTGTSGQFMDKPWMLVGRPNSGSQMVTIPSDPPQTVPCGPVFVGFAKFTGSNSSKVEITRSDDCGETFNHPKKVSQNNTLNQGVAGAIDPVTGDVYVAWRRFQTSSNTNAIMFSKSTNNGQSYSQNAEVAQIVPFDQGISATSFRTQSLPTMAISVDGGGQSRVHLAWAERGVPGGDARIVMTTSGDGGNTWSTPTPVDDSPIVDDFGNEFTQGHQLMPAMTFSAGKLLVLYYESRLDHTIGLFHPNDPFVADSQGRFYRERRDPRGELPANPGLVFTPFLDDFGLTLRRHTIDLRVSQTDPGPSPSFTSAMVSRYPFGTRGDELGTVESLPQLQVNPPNFPLFSQGQLAFIGDYIDIQGLAFLPPESPEGEWQYNLAASSGAVHHATWTSNQDVRPPPDGDWTSYTPVGGGGPSLFNPAVNSPPCIPGREGMRNQNIYTSRISQGLLVSSPQNAKPLSETLTRAFVVTAQNFTEDDRAFRLTIANQPVDGKASWLQIHGPTDPDPLTELDLEIGSISGVARTIFATSSNPTERIRVDVTEITALGGTIVPDGLSGSVVFNSDPTAPALTNPDGVTDPSQDISIVEIYAPNVTNPNVTNPNVTNPNVTNPNVTNPNVTNPNVTNPNVTNPDVADPNVTNPNVTNPNVTNPNVTNPNVTNPNVTNTAVSDATYTVTNEGNTSTSFRVKLVGDEPDADVQLIVSKTVTNPIGLNCELLQEQNSVVLANIRNPVFEDASSFDPNIPDPSLSNATFALRPGETALVTLRGEIDTVVMQGVVASSVPVIIPHPSGNAAAPLLITTDSLPDASLGVPYNATLEIIGPDSGLTWSVSDGALPEGLSLDPVTGEITGTPTSAGTANFTVEVTDSESPQGMSRESLTLNVVQVTAATSVDSSDNPAVFGQAVTFSATVTPSASGAPDATGTVTFKDGETTLGTATLSGGSASLSRSDLTVGSHSITASHEGDSNYFPSVSDALTQTIDQAATAAMVASSSNPSVLGQTVTFSATVSAVAPGAGTPTGGVTFLDGAAALGSATLVDGGASLTISTLGVGDHSITVVYDGDGDFLGSGSDPSIQSVGPAATTTVVASSDSSSVLGQPVTLTATVAGASTLASPMGNVTFFDGATALGSTALAGDSASLTTTTLAVGAHSITAVYAGDANFVGSTSAALTQMVGQAETTISVVSATGPSVFGQSVTFTATVEVVAPGVGNPSGTVTFRDGTTILGSETLSGGSASLGTAGLGVGPHAITATYEGDLDFSSSVSAELTQIVDQAATTTSVITDTNSSAFGQTVTFTATVEVAAPGVGDPSGTVTFRDGATILGSEALSGGSASFGTAGLGVGPHAITATYEGDAEFAGSASAELNQTVDQAATTTSVVSDTTPSAFGQGVTFTATVEVAAPGVGLPTGTVTFFDGATELGAGTLTDGSASFSTAALTAGSHSITAIYSGDVEFAGSTSAELTQTVNAALTSSSVVSDANPSIFGQTVNFTATVDGGGAGTPSGTVTFKDGATALGTGTLVGGSASFGTSGLAVGAHSITATYEGDGNFAGSTSAALTQTVEQVATTTTVSADVNPSALDQTVSFTADVDGGAAGTPGGTVTFKDGTTTLGSSTLAGGTATFSTGTLEAGNHAITAVYGGDALFAGSTSAVLTQSVAYNFNGFLSPLASAGTLSAPSFSGVRNLGQAVPIKWQLTTFDGTFVRQRSTAKTLKASFNTDCAGAPEGPEILLYEPTSGATGGSTFRYTRKDEQFVFNWDTSVGVPTGPGCYSLVLELDDESVPKATIVELQ